MSKTLGTVFDLKEIFEKATDLIFRGTPADRVVALLADETLDGTHPRPQPLSRSAPERAKRASKN